MVDTPNSTSPSHHSAEEIADMATYGITQQSFEYFYHGEYRYTSLRDAVAQAKRMAGNS